MSGPAERSLKRVGVFGGSFNPIHHGHLVLADEILERLGLDRMLFVPAAIPPHKASRELAPAVDRSRMVELAIARHPGFAVSDVELSRPGVSYTVETLTALQERGQELYFVIGSETFLDLLSWREPRRLARLARLVVVPRAGSTFDPDSAAALKILREIGVDRFGIVDRLPVPENAVLIVHAMSLPISASELRRRIRDGRSVESRMPEAVIDYVRAHGLYRGDAAA
jgi:nicotinate-nucleotide adenylyltransferase